MFHTDGLGSGEVSIRDKSDPSDLVGSVSRIFQSHPGFMWTESGFEVLHADWPAYPRGHGIEIALRTLADFPNGTTFYEVDWIDRCRLFVVGDKPLGDVYSAQRMHVALWDEDICACSTHGFIEGAQCSLDEIWFPNGCISLTEIGLQVVTIFELMHGVARQLWSLVSELFYEGKYEIGVREAALHIEMRMRTISKSQKYGAALVEDCWGQNGLLVPRDLTNADRLAIRQVFRSYFAYVRNEYMHSRPETNMISACRLLQRSSGLLQILEQMEILNQETRR